MATVTFENVNKMYGDFHAVKDLNLEIGDGEFMVLVGPSGCGKTTSLRMIAGLEEISGGTLRIGDRVVNDVPPKDRDIAMVFQSYALYPHMSVRDNLAFGLKLRKVPKPEIERRVNEAAETIQLQKLLDRKPKELSGGQRQRVALGRAIVREPSVFLMDEPLSNLDAKLRVETRSNIASLQARLGTTTLYVTHDQVEAMTMGHRVAVLKDGVLQQVDTPRNLYDRPCNAFVGGFIGSPGMNQRTVPVRSDGAVLGNVVVPLDGSVQAAAAGLPEITLGLRPEAFSIGSNGGLQVEVRLVEELGADAYVYGALKDDPADAKPFVLRFDGRVPPRLGETIDVQVRAAEAHAFHPQTGERLG